MANYLTKNLKQTAVYWATGTRSGYGGMTLGQGIEIAVRWMDVETLIIDAKGNERKSTTMVLVDRDVEIGGWLFLGDLEDIASSDEDNPELVSGAREIRGFHKIPNIKATGFIRKAFL